MQVGDLIRLSELAVGVYGFDSDIGLIVAKVPQSIHSAAQEYPDDYQILINGKVEIAGFDIEKHCKVINESR